MKCKEKFNTFLTLPCQVYTPEMVGPPTKHRAVNANRRTPRTLSLYPNMAEGLELREVVFAILTLLLFQAVSEIQSDSHNIPHCGKNNSCFHPNINCVTDYVYGEMYYWSSLTSSKEPTAHKFKICT
jgi:hypothetical protein